MSYGNYSEAQVIYDSLFTKNSDNIEYKFYSGICDFHLKRENSAIQKFNEILIPVRKSGKNSESEFQISMFLAKANHNIYMFDKEIEIYDLLLTKDYKKKRIAKINESKTDALEAIQLFQDFQQIVVTKLAILNSGYDDHTPIPDASGQMIFFTSKRKGGTGKAKSPEGKYYEDIYVWNRNLGLWSKPYNIGPPVNTESHEATAGLSPDGKTLFIFKADKKSAGDLYVSFLNDTLWSTPKLLGKNINKKRSREQHAAISPDGNTLFFSTDRVGGQGNSDIWISKKKDDGTWGKAYSASFNTKHDEGSPFLLEEGRVLYFSSKGFNGMGGFDVFRTELQNDGVWSTPKNIGFPINTVGDDVFYFPAGNENIAYFTRREEGSANIYKAQLFGEQEQFIIVQGIINDNKHYSKSYPVSKINNDTIFFEKGFRLKNQKNIVNGDSVENFKLKDSTLIANIYFVPEAEQISIFDVNNDKYTDLYKCNSDKGDYKFILQPARNYKIVYEADGLLFDSRNISAKEAQNGKRINYNAELGRIEHGKTEKIKLTPFEENKSELNDFTLKELELINTYLNKYPQLVINFSANNPNYENQQLLTDREDAAADYLSKKGISDNRIYRGLSIDTIQNNMLQYMIFEEQVVAVIEQEIIQKKDSIENIKKTDIKSEINIEIENSYFDFNGSQLRKMNEVDSLAQYLINNPEAKVLIVGYTDAVGSISYNQSLSVRRAKSVKTELLRLGANSNQIETKGFGESNPVSLNKINGNWHEPSKKFNRRVEFKIIKQGNPKVKIIQMQDIPKKYENSKYDSNFKYE